MIDRVDPELIGPLEALLAAWGGPLDLRDIPAVRAGMAASSAAHASPAVEDDGVAADDRFVPGPAGEPDVAVRIYRLRGESAPRPAFLWMHPGGYVLGAMAADDPLARHLATAADCVVVNVEYRLAPEHPFPGPLEDCYAALVWLARHAGELGVDPGRIGIGGGSAGGGLAAGLALLARDRAAVPVAFQLLIYPMLDDRTAAMAGEGLPDALIWSRANNNHGWSAYLGRTPGGDGVSSYAAAARAASLEGLPSAYIAVGALDLFLNEDLDYARRLMATGIPTELHVYPGAYHGFDGFGPEAAVSRRFAAERDDALRRALHG